MLDLQKRVIEEQIKKHNELLEQWSKQHGVTPETAHDFQLSMEKTIYWATYRIHKDWNLVSELKIEFDPLVSE